MKKFKHILIAISVAMTFTCCDAFRSVTSQSISSKGAPYELIVVCNQPEWESALGDTLQSILSAHVPFVNQDEPLFTVLRVTVNGYDNLIPQHRNILEVNITPDAKEAAMSVRYDVNAKPQIIVTLQAPTIEAGVEYVDQNRESILKVLEMAERDRDVEYAQKFNIESLNQLIKEKFGVDMKVPDGYSLRNEGDDFVWISYEYPTASQGFILYSYPAQFGINSLSAEMLVDARNKFVSKIPGPSDGSYMITYEEFTPSYTPLRIDGRLWCEMRGFWDVANDYMGGPYVSYSTIDTQTNMVFTIDCYVYSPKLGKRNFIRGLEHLVYNIKFPEDESTNE